MPKSAGYVSPQYLKMIASIVKSFKCSSYALMNIKKGDSVLDIGCGPGIDTIEMAPLVGDTGKVYGIDIDEEMVELASKDAKDKHLDQYVIHKTASLANMPFADSSIDSCRAERLFQVIPSYIDRLPLFDEIYRVLKPSGVVVLIDTDWATASVDFSDVSLERKLLTFFATQMRPDGFAGRSFKRYLSYSKFTNITINTVSFVHHKFEETAFGDWLTSTALEKNVITQAEANLWNMELTEKSKNGTFYASVGSVIAVAKK